MTRKVPNLISYAVLDEQGQLVANKSRLPDMRQDPASTTKLWTLYTILTEMKNGTLPKDFLITHGDDAEKMMTRSDNAAACRLGKAAGHGSIAAFCETMTKLAHEKGMASTNFNAPNGELQTGNYSTARDIALAMYRFETDFPKRINWFKERHYAGVDQHGCPELKKGGDPACTNTDREMVGKHRVAGGKTGTGNSTFTNADGSIGYGSEGRFAFAGFTDDARGAFAVLGAMTKPERNAAVFAAADVLNSLPRRPAAAPQPASAAPRRLEVAHVDSAGSAPTSLPWQILQTAMSMFGFK